MVAIETEYENDHNLITGFMHLFQKFVFPLTIVMVSCQEYQLLHESMQATLLKRDGIHLMHRKTAQLNIGLFSLYDFYVEVFVNKEDDEPLYFKSFEYGKNLNVYLEAIVIGEFSKVFKPK